MGHVELAVDEPTRVRRLPVEDAIPALEPLEMLCLLLPEGLRVRFRALIQQRIGSGGLLPKCFRGRVGPLLPQQLGEDAFGA